MTRGYPYPVPLSLPLSNVQTWGVGVAVSAPRPVSKAKSGTLPGSAICGGVMQGLMQVHMGPDLGLCRGYAEHAGTQGELCMQCTTLGSACMHNPDPGMEVDVQSFREEEASRGPR